MRNYKRKCLSCGKGIIIRKGGHQRLYCRMCQWRKNHGQVIIQHPGTNGVKETVIMPKKLVLERICGRCGKTYMPRPKLDNLRKYCFTCNPPGKWPCKPEQPAKEAPVQAVQQQLGEFIIRISVERVK